MPRAIILLYATSNNISPPKSYIYLITLRSTIHQYTRPEVTSNITRCGLACPGQRESLALWPIAFPSFQSQPFSFLVQDLVHNEQLRRKCSQIPSGARASSGHLTNMSLKRKASFSAMPDGLSVPASGEWAIVDSSKHLHSRTRKRFRDGRPSDEIVYGKFLQ